ncbi:MAG: hypothetical protein LBE35_09165 [Clostridiales bacterium]|jgi:hypothetical protein|nr:hypothetical protein [Clostridiales bacterium]
MENKTKRKTTTSSQVKRKYNVKTYKVYRIPVRFDSELFKKIEEYQSQGSVSSLVQSLLKEHFKIP